ncbi:MAG TPA: tRNA pseudouridine(55) synthase TruB [Candidatus Limnocylindrales bacterium]|nr:tRNA pseudouridine(55) synthase TruB [Candidatus Limnocylindrales bacterium]
MNGIVIINKPFGVTSHQVVSFVRKLFPGIKAGHTGTLDPMATGVLPVCLGKATRVVEYVIELPKYYRAEIVLGTTTNTEDAMGEVLEQLPVPHLERAHLENILQKFTGTIKQLPPLYSAIKYRGKPLYHWTRQGEVVPRQLRKAEVYSIDLRSYNPDQLPQLIIDVKCSRGTYIRTLASDLGKTVGCGAHLSALVRLSVGPYTLENSFSPSELEQKILTGQEGSVLQTMDTALMQFPQVICSEDTIRAMKYGQFVGIDKSGFSNNYATGDSLIRVCDSQGNFKAIAGWFEADGQIQLKTIKYLTS